MNHQQRAHRRGRLPWHSVAGRTAAAVSSVALLALATGAATVQDGAAGGAENARVALEKWVETQRVISAEKRDWALGKELLEDRVELVRSEIEALRAKVTDAQESIAEADRTRQERLEEKERLERTAAALRDIAIGLEERVRSLIVRLPDPIRERIKPLSQRLPEDSTDTKLSLSERFQNVVGMLNEVDKFHREITVTSEVLPLPDGTTAEVTALYVGIGQGYYVGAEGRVAGVGSASPQGWVWKPANEMAPAVSTAVAVFENEEQAQFVRLPVRIE